jgi:NAD(P)-dependent dehydrogenase (short-subunit alcohol dehydrogenase family)
MGMPGGRAERGDNEHSSQYGGSARRYLNTDADVTEAHIDKGFDVNVKGTFVSVQKALPLMSEEGSSTLTGCTAGSTGFRA